ncbi:MAG: hypothetical protein R2839_00540 [Thermomicrobiales bacterium]
MSGFEWATRHADMVEASVVVAATPTPGPLPIASTRQVAGRSWPDPD